MPCGYVSILSKEARLTQYLCFVWGPSVGFFPGRAAAHRTRPDRWSSSPLPQRMPSSAHKDSGLTHCVFTNSVRSLLSRGTSVRSARGNLRNSDTAASAPPPQHLRTDSMSASASAHQTARPVFDGGMADEAAAVNAPGPFWRHQSEETLFRPPKVPFPPPSSVSVEAVWSWQMGEGLWIPFDLRVMHLLESLWVHLQERDAPPHAVQGTREETQESQQPQEQQEQEQEQEDEQGQELGQEWEGDDEQDVGDQTGGGGPESFVQQSQRLYVQLLPWRYCLDLRTMTQKNLSTHRVRPIRRVFETVGLWFARGTDGYAERCVDLWHIGYTTWS